MRLKDTMGAWDRKGSWEGKYKKNVITIAESDGVFYWYFSKSDMSHNTLWENQVFQTIEETTAHAKKWIDEKIKGGKVHG